LTIASPSVSLLNTTASTPASSTASSWFVLVFLTFLVVLVAVVVWFYKRRLGFAADDGFIRILSSRPLGAREQIVVASVYGRVLVLGHTPSQVSVLCELQPEEVPEGPSLPPRPDFSKLLSRFTQKVGGQ
jgi:flagellar protein FliO/FliZ